MKELTLKERFELVAQDYLTAFVKKQKYGFDYWVADEVGGIASFIDQYFFSFEEIRIDIDFKAPKGAIFKYQDECVVNEYKKRKKTMPNYRNWLVLNNLVKNK